MPDNNSEQYLLNEQVSFVQHALPGLDAGEYQLQLNQQVFQSDGKTPVSGEAYSNTYTFAVTSDRFSLANPGSVINSVFPNDNASGEFSNVLPHVVFNKTTFPWTRYPTLKEPYDPPQPGKDVDGDVPTWLWVLLLDDDDTAAYPALTNSITPCTTCDLFPKTAYANSKIPDNTYSYFYAATDLADLEPGQNTADNINVIDVPMGLFWQLAPSIDDLELMAHVRIVSLVNQPTNGNSNGEPTGSFSIVFGNRLPNTQRKTRAYLVSLEGLEVFLPQDDGSIPSATNYKQTDTIRLAVLANWTFFSTGESATFVHQLESLNDCTPGSGVPASNTNIRIPYAGSNAVVAGAFNMGFVPLNQTMRTAEKNVSWYRGPLLPYSNAGANPLQVPIPSPDAANVFDPTTGMLDTSYAAAWTIGRMVALQDTSFSTGLYNWKKGLAQQVNNNVENTLMMQYFNVQPSPQPALSQRSGKRVSLLPGSIFKQTVLKLKQ
ncbi:hypothetical protein [Chitinophaga sp. LS1]|uniref:hypothetical protein n=1 Tax=Chitinophaga sp. LS1 TaxID=3051176 RepID=UPI002AAAD9FF|nr:hypothetical protein [Chitinophaga sp. LS1]WPV64831.1 hypothetical protein QQL36_23800 [Chitinophaga sp. LS1]